MSGGAQSSFSPRTRLLVVDDDPRFLEALQAMLSYLCYDVTRARSSQEAHELLRRGHYDVILSDLTLFDGDVMNFLRVAREHSPAIPVIFLTGTGDVALLREARLGGAVTCLCKPVRMRELRAWIESCARA